MRADAVVLFCCSGGKAPESLPASSLRKNLAGVMKLEGFSGKEGEILVWHAPGKAAARRYVVVGSGKKGEVASTTVLLVNVPERV